MAMLTSRVCTVCTLHSCTLTSIEYAAPVWDPHLVKDITRLDNVQKFAMKN